MAENGTPDDSISVLEDTPLSDLSTNGAGLGIPEFHIVTSRANITTSRAADVSDASHYALNQACQSLQKKNRELEQQLHRLQRENIKFRRKRISSQGDSGDQTGNNSADMSLSPPNSGLLGRGISPELTRTSVGGLVNGTTPGLANPHEEFIQYLHKELEREQLQRRDTSNRLDEEKAKSHKLEQRVRDLSRELTEAMDIVTSRRTEIERLTAECDNLGVSNKQLMGQIRAQNTQGDGVDILKRRIREIQGEYSQLQTEHNDMQQLYEENSTKTEELEQKFEEQTNKCQELESLIEEKDIEISRLKRSNQQKTEQIESMSQLNEYLQRQLDTERAERTSDQGDLVATGTTVSAMVPTQAERSDSEDMIALEETTSQVALLRQQVLGMQAVIQEQSTMIRDLANKIKRRSQGSLASSTGGSVSGGTVTPRIATPPLQGPHQGARPKIPGHNTSPARQRPQTSSESERMPVACAEDLESIGNGDLTTLIDVLAEANNQLTRSDITTGMERIMSPLPRTGLVLNSERSSSPNTHQVAGGSTGTHQVAGGSTGAHMVAGGSSANPQGAIPKLNFHAQAKTEPIIRHPPPFYEVASAPAAAGASSVTEPLMGDNRLNPLTSSSASNRNITIERNLEDETMTPPGRNNQNQNINLKEMSRDKYTVNSSGVTSNNPYVAAKPVPARNIYTETVNRTPPDGDVGASGSPQGAPPRTCPVCNKTFPLALSQEAFENHVHYCLNTSSFEPLETTNTSPSPSHQSDTINEPRDEAIYECPVCNALQPPGTTENQFLTHVDAHFAESDDNFEVVQP